MTTTTKVRSPRLFRPSLSLKLMIVGLVITIGFILIALLAPSLQAWGWLQDPTESLSNPIHEPPGLDYWFGTTRQGYDVFARTLFGTQAALKVVILATTMSLLLGVPVGLVSGYLGGKGRQSFIIPDGYHLYLAWVATFGDFSLCSWQRSI